MAREVPDTGGNQADLPGENDVSEIKSWKETGIRRSECSSLRLRAQEPNTSHLQTAKLVVALFSQKSQKPKWM